MELIISEEEGEAPISIEEQTRIESDDKIIITEHRGITGPECKAGNVLEGASNAEDLGVLAECQDAIGTVMHTKKMDDGDYKFFLDVEEQFKFLVNDKNNEKTDGFLVVEIVLHIKMVCIFPKMVTECMYGEHGLQTSQKDGMKYTLRGKLLTNSIDTCFPEYSTKNSQSGRQLRYQLCLSMAIAGFLFSSISSTANAQIEVTVDGNMSS